MKKNLLKIILIIPIIILLYYILNKIYIYELVTDYWNNVIYDKNLNVISWIKNLSYSSYDDIPYELKEIIINIEDRRFYKHNWIDFISIIRAFKNNLTSNSIQWWSTINQQSIKLSQKAYNRNYRQKFVELFFWLNININYSKEEILTYYINNLEFINWVIWFKSACNFYFNRDCNSLFLSEKLFLVSVYQTWRNPLNSNNFHLLKNRSKLLCNQLNAKNLNKIDYTCNNIDLLPPTTSNNINNSFNNIARHYTDYVNIYDFNNNEKSFYNTNLHNKIENIIFNTKNYRDNVWAKDCCIVVLDWDWNIISMNICRDYDDIFAWQVNACTSKRQTWSVAKPFLYIYAMKNLNLTWWSILYDIPTDYILNWDNIYSPQNFSLRHYWEVELWKALGSSLNIPTVNLLNDVWVWNYIEFINFLRLFIWNENNDIIQRDIKIFNEINLWLSAALWTYELSPISFAQLWKIFFYDIEKLNYNFNWDNLMSYHKEIDEVYNILKLNSNRILSFWLDSFLVMPWWSVKSWTSRRFIDWWTCWANKDINYILCVWTWNYNWSSMTDSWVNTAWYLWNLVASILNN